MIVDGSRPPRWHELLAIGFDRLLDVRRYLWYLAASVALTVALGLLRDRPGGLLLGVMLVTLNSLASVVLSRQLMTGRSRSSSMTLLPRPAWSGCFCWWWSSARFSSCR